MPVYWVEIIRSTNLTLQVYRSGNNGSNEGCKLFFLICIVGGGVQFGPLGTAATNRPIVPAPDDYDNREIGGMIGRGNRSTRRKPVPMPLCSPQTPQAVRTRTRVAALGSQWLTAWATARPGCKLNYIYVFCHVPTLYLYYVRCFTCERITEVKFYFL
jgi:hypothetical protein